MVTFLHVFLPKRMHIFPMRATYLVHSILDFNIMLFGFLSQKSLLSSVNYTRTERSPDAGDHSCSGTINRVTNLCSDRRHGSVLK
jgi:hypothetical protein